ncbi:MAG: ABC transporter permease subunit [Thermoleophilia bacterium]
MARQRAARLSRPPASGRWALAPAVVVLGLLTAAGVGYAAAQSLGAFPVAGHSRVGLQAYRQLLGGGGPVTDLWSSAMFTLWVSAASTLAATALALGAVAWADRPASRGRRLATGLLHINLAIPHAVWAVALLLVASQSGVLARAAAAVGLIDRPAQMPLLVSDPQGLGIVLHYATKEAPFLALVGLALLRAQPPELRIVARVMGATGLRHVRLVTLPAVLPGLAAAAGLVFVFVFGAYEAPAVLGVSAPRTLSVLGLDLFQDGDLATRPVAMALGVLMTMAVVTLLGVAAFLAGRRR